MKQVLLQRAPVQRYSSVVHTIGVLKGTKSTFEVHVLTNPVTKQPEGIALKLRTQKKTETVRIQNSLGDQGNQNFRYHFLNFTIRLGRLLEDDKFDTLLHQMLEENRILVYNKDKEVVLWKNGIRSPVNITSVFFARAVLPIESKEAKLEKERACLPYKSPKKLQAFFQEYRSTSLPLGSNGDIFAPREGGSSDMERFRVWECGFEYVNPPEKLIVIGHFQGDAAVMVGTKSGKVYLDKDEIVYNVADTLSDFADKGCRKNPTFFDFCLARPKDVNSLPCAAGTYKDEKLAEDIPEEDRWTFIGHDPKELETDREKARRLYAERADYFKHPPEDFLDFSNEENQSQSESFFAQFDPNEVNQEPFWSWPCQDIPTSNPFNQHAFQLCVET